MPRFIDPSKVEKIMGVLTMDWQGTRALEKASGVNKTPLRNYLEYLAKNGKVQKEERGKGKALFWRLPQSAHKD